MRADRGLKRKAENGVYYVRRRVPDDVRAAFGGRQELVRSLETTDSRLAEKRRDDAWSEWDARIAEARGRLVAESTLPRLLRAIDDWRSQRCAAAAQTGTESAWEIAESVLSFMHQMPSLSHLGAVGLYGAELDAPDSARQPSPARPPFFKRHPDASRDLAMPYRTALLIGRLQVASRDPAAWREVDNFDYALDAALAEAGLSEAPSTLRSDLRQPFARAWLEVVQHEELERLRAVAALARPEDMRAAPGAAAYVPREGDRSVAELIAAYRNEREGAHGVESTGRKYGHIFSALREALGDEKPLRAITRTDCKALRDLLRAIPSHMRKRFPGLSMTEAAEAAASADEGVERLAPNTVNSYLSNLIAMMNWAVQEGWVDTNPASGLVDKDLPVVRRRAFTRTELETLFSSLAEERRRNDWRFWLPALGLYTGARLNELCQLRVSDVQSWDGIAFLSISVFDETGRRSRYKRLKTEPSQRNIPIHPALIEAGFLTFVRSIEQERLFPEIKAISTRSLSHEPSKWFASHLDRCDLSDPCLVFHSFRHGFKDCCDADGVDPEYRRALGGWAATSESEKYGNRQFVPLLAREVAKLGFSDFLLTVSEPANSDTRSAKNFMTRCLDKLHSG